MAHASGGKATGAAGVMGRVYGAFARRGTSRALGGSVAMGIAMLLTTVLIVGVVSQDAAMAEDAGDTSSAVDSQTTAETSAAGQQDAPDSGVVVPDEPAVDDPAVDDPATSEPGPAEGVAEPIEGGDEALDTPADEPQDVAEAARSDALAGGGDLVAAAAADDGGFGILAAGPLELDLTIRIAIVDANGLNPQPAAGWSVSNLFGRATGGSISSSPANGSSQPTNATGSARWLGTFSAAGATASVTSNFAMQTGYWFVSASCTVTLQNGSTSVVTIPTVGAPAGTFSAGTTVDCTYNVQQIPASGSLVVCGADYTYSMRNNGVIQRIRSGSVTQLPGGWSLRNGADANGIAITPGGTAVYAFERLATDANDQIYSVLRYNTVARTYQTFSVPLNEPGTAFVVGAFDPNSNRYIFGGYRLNGTNDELRLWAFNPANNAVSYLGAAPAGASVGATNGDIAFDSLGNLFLVKSVNTSVQVFSITAANLAAATGGTIPSFSAVAANQPAAFNINGIAFDTDGSVLLGSTQTVTRFNPATWAQIGSALTVPGLSSQDLASCNTPASLTVRKDVVKRHSATDQFTLNAISGTQTFATATTTGTATGIQTEQAGPAPVVRGATYQIAEAAASGSLANYVSSWQCIVQQTGAVVASGTGTGGSVTIPAAANASVVCTITNTPNTSTIIVRKVVQDVNGLNPQPASGWTMSAALSRITGSVTTSPAGSQQTAANGATQWTLTYTAATGRADVTPAETMQANYTFVSGTCTVTEADRTTRVVAMTSAAGSAVTGVGPGATVDCTYTNRLAVGQLTWNKLGASGRPLAGTQWRLTKTDAFSVPVTPAVTVNVVDCTSAPCTGADTNPTTAAFTVPSLGFGYYTLTETVAPAGYILDPSPRGPVPISATTPSATFGAITNREDVGGVTWRKVDETGSLLHGSEWLLTQTTINGTPVVPSTTYAVVDCSVAPCTGTDKDADAGEFSVTGLTASWYTLRETKAPAGFVPIMTTFGPVRVGALTPGATFGDIENIRQTPVILPLSGGAGTTVFLAGGLGVLGAAAIVWFLMLGRRRRRDEELIGGSAEAPETYQGGMSL